MLFSFYRLPPRREITRKPDSAPGDSRESVEPAKSVGYDELSRSPSRSPTRKTAMRPSRLLLPVIAFALVSPVRAEHARITLDVESEGQKVTAHVDQTPPVSGKNPRPVLKARVGETIRVQWMFQNTYPHKTLKDVVVHFFIAPESEVGQKELPTLGDDVVVESAFDMDFKPGTHAGGRQTLTITRPGTYLIRVESLKTQSDHEHFSAMDLVVE